MTINNLRKAQLLPVGGFPRVDVTSIPKPVSDDFSRTILACVRKSCQTEGVVAEYERWLSDYQAKQNEKSKQNG